MKIFYDCEFLEGAQKKLFKKTVPTIDLISIGLVDEEDREMYLISKEFNLKEAWNRYDLKVEPTYGDLRNKYPNGRKFKCYWIRENVLKPIFDYFIKCENAKNYRKSQLYISGVSVNYSFTYKNFKKLLFKYGLSRQEIKIKLLSFSLDPGGLIYSKWLDGINDYLKTLERKETKIELYGYYSAYDHVCLSWIFGKMLNLPDQFPMYTKDLKQISDDYFKDIPIHIVDEIKAGHVIVDNDKVYPQNKGAHDALQDALWNKKLYEFLTNAL